MLQPSLGWLVISSNMLDKPENVTFSRTLSIKEPNNELVILGCVLGVLASSVLLVALYALYSLMQALHLASSSHPTRLQLARPRCYAATCSSSTAPQRRRPSWLRR